MNVKASIDHQVTTDLQSGAPGLAEFLLLKAVEWSGGRRSGDFWIDHDGTTTKVFFGDITRFAVEVSS